MQGQGYRRIVNTSSDSIYGFGRGGDAGYVGSKGAIFGMTRDLGRFSAQHGIRINEVMPPASSRMSDLSTLAKKIHREYFDASQVAVFVAALACKEYPVSGKSFSMGGGRAARTTLATFPGWNGDSSVESYLENFEKVMGMRDEV
jgi:NAD(P)-dependent dehydrogenase (short-subunit alcohol dehydrogenase family)